MVFDDAGRSVNPFTQRYREISGRFSLDPISGRFSLDPWSTPIMEYGVHADLNLPVRAQALWKLPSGDLSYRDREITDVEYNGSIEAF